MQGVTCAWTWRTGTGRDGWPRDVYLHHVVDNAWTIPEFGSQAVVWQTAVNPAVALELVASGAWSGAGCSAPRRSPLIRSSSSSSIRACRGVSRNAHPAIAALAQSGTGGFVGPGRHLKRRLPHVEVTKGVLENQLGQLHGTGVQDPGVERHPAGIGLGGGELLLQPPTATSPVQDPGGRGATKKQCFCGQRERQGRSHPPTPIKTKRTSDRRLRLGAALSPGLLLTPRRWAPRARAPSSGAGVCRAPNRGSHPRWDAPHPRPPR